MSDEVKPPEESNVKYEPQPPPHKRQLKAAAEIIKEFEGLRLKAYLDGGGVPTIGWGHTKGVRLGQKITTEQAQSFFDADFLEHMLPVQRRVKVALNDNEFGALVSLCYNIGAGAFGGSTLLKKLNQGKSRAEVATHFMSWVNDNGKRIAGLVRRRGLEKKLFLTPTDQVPTLLTLWENHDDAEDLSVANNVDSEDVREALA